MSSLSLTLAQSHASTTPTANRWVISWLASQYKDGSGSVEPFICIVECNMSDKAMAFARTHFRLLNGERDTKTCTWEVPNSAICYSLDTHEAPPKLIFSSLDVPALGAKPE